MHGLAGLRAVLVLALVTSIIPFFAGSTSSPFAPDLWAAEEEAAEQAAEEPAPADSGQTPEVAEPEKSGETGKDQTNTNGATTEGDTPPPLEKPLDQVMTEPDSVISTGAATIKVPIRVPPGRAGIAPNLNLTYNSFRRNGWVGIGWDIDLGAIQRSTKRGVKYGTTYEATDGTDDYVVLENGTNSELVPRRSHWGVNYYGLKIEGPFIKYYRDTASGGWVVTTKDGTKYYYGSEPATRQDNQFGTFKWCLDKVQDMNGNTMTVTYFKDIANGEIYPHEISYTENSRASLGATHLVHFELEAKPDTVLSYVSNVPVKTLYRLKKIEVKENGFLLRRYDLTYSPRGSGRHVVTQIQEFDKNGVAFPANSLEWDANGSDTFALNPEHPVSSGIFPPTCFPGDANGDGKSDFLCGINDGYNTTLYSVISNGDGTFQSFSTINDVGGRIFPGDINGDGKTDIMYASQYAFGALISNGNGTFSPGPGGDLPYHMAIIMPTVENPTWFSGDVNGDGLSDFMFMSSGYSFTVITREDGTFTVGTPSGSGGSSSQYSNTFFPGDVNGDGKTDFMSVVVDLYSQLAYLEAQISNGDGTFSGGGGAAFYVNGARWFPGDANGDGRTDFMGVDRSDLSGPATLITAFSRTAGQSFDVVQYPTGLWMSTASVGDIDADGKTDFVAFGTWGAQGLFAAISKGDGTYRLTSQPEPAVPTGIWYTSDINGDGKADYSGIYHSDAYGDMGMHFYTAFSQFAFDRITSVTNPFGGKSTFTYDFSSRWANTYMPLIVQTVTELKKDDGRGQPTSVIKSQYTYSKGYYNPAEREFRGFGEVNAYLGTTTAYESVTQTLFNQGLLARHNGGAAQDPALKRTVQRQLTTSKPGEGHSKQIDNTWIPYDVGASRFPHLDTVTTTTIDRTNCGFVFSTKYDYDSSLNVTSEHRRDVTNGEEIDTAYTYTNDTVNHIFKPTSTTVHNDAGDVVSKKWMTYENGNIHTEEACIEANGNNCTQGSANNAVTHYEYYPDNMGLLLRINDPRGFKTEFPTYDATKTYVKDKKQCVNSACTSYLLTTTEYDTGLGKLIRMVPPHLQGTPYEWAYVYDGFGRITDETRPDTGYTEYDYYNTGSPTNQYVRKRDHVLLGIVPSLTNDTYTYFDGLNRTYKVTTTAPASNLTASPLITVDTSYDSYGRIKTRSNPYLNGETTQNTVYDYDGMSRVTRITKPDSGTINIEYWGLTKKVQNERGYWTSYLSDSFGRLRKVTDANDPTPTETNYTYDAVGNLTTVVAAANIPGLTNTTTMIYDSASRKIEMTDPDMGHWYYTYDKSNNLSTQTDAQNPPVAFGYDGINRLILKTYSDHTVTYTYDDPAVPYSKGALTKVADSYGNIDQVLAFDVMQRPISSRKTIGSSSGNPVTIDKTYDTVGRVAKIIYFPNFPASSRTYRYSYDNSGSLVSVQQLYSDLTTRDLSVYSNYNAMKQHGTVTYPKASGISVVSSYTYDPSTFRIGTLRTRKGADAYLQDLSYIFDKRGNLITKTDTRANLTHTYTYDRLDRLKSVTGSGAFSYSQLYSYDVLGNITCKSDVGSYSYTYANKPHAVRSAGNITLQYDNNGNMTRRAVSGGVTLDIDYNQDNMPKAIRKNTSNYLTFEYDGNNQRVKKALASGSNYTYYYGEAYEERTVGGSTTGVIHLYAGAERLVSIRSGGEEQYYHPDHISSASVVTDGNGDIRERLEYFPFGSYRERTDFGSTFPDVNYTFTGQEDDDEVGLYNYKARLYDPVLGRFLSADSVVPDWTDLQNFNRYSYCLNNPLKYTDPSGHGVAATTGQAAGSLGCASLGAAAAAISGSAVTGAGFSIACGLALAVANGDSVGATAATSAICTTVGRAVGVFNPNWSDVAELTCDTTAGVVLGLIGVGGPPNAAPGPATSASPYSYNYNIPGPATSASPYSYNYNIPGPATSAGPNGQSSSGNYGYDGYSE